jgi:hypothetical protein
LTGLTGLTGGSFFEGGKFYQELFEFAPIGTKPLLEKPYYMFRYA